MYADIMYNGFRGLFGGPPTASAYTQAQYFGGMTNGSDKLPCALAFTPSKTDVWGHSQYFIVFIRLG